MDGSVVMTDRKSLLSAFSSMGEPAERIRQELMGWAQEMSKCVEPAYATALEQAQHYLEAQTCRVAVIGQVKAGKSSFINALVGRPDLLPNDVNPWTTVVTNLHFYRTPAASESSVFTLFDGDEWNRIAESGGVLRELTERLVPGFDPHLLRSQIDAMRKRAEERLGPSLASLLGQSHTFATVDKGVLARYVSAGTETTLTDAFGGCYSDITKTADLYFGSDRPGFPVTLVDTPGTNDPLLVRDEITRQSLASAEIYVVVLTAQQPLSAEDLALLRLLRGLHKERIIIFINRIDGLRDIAGSVARLVSHVEAHLRHEFPMIDFPIIVGSARWANCAVSFDANEIASTLDASLRHYAAQRGVCAFEAMEPGRGASATVVNALLELSGIPAVTQAIGRLMLRGEAAYRIRQLATFFLELARSAETAERMQLNSLERALCEIKAHAGTQDRDLRLWRQELDQIESSANQLKAGLAVYETSLRTMVDRCVGDLHALLGQCVDRFTSVQVERLNEAYRSKSTEVWLCDSAPLRHQLQEEFLRIYRYWENNLLQAQSMILTELQSIMPAIATPSGEVSTLMRTNLARHYPDMSSLGRTVSLDLSVPWWSVLWRSRPTLESRIDALTRIISREFYPLIDELASAASAALTEHAKYAARHVALGSFDIVDRTHRRRSELVGLLQQSGHMGLEAQQRMERQFGEIAESVAYWSRISSGLSDLVERCGTDLADSTAAFE